MMSNLDLPATQNVTLLVYEKLNCSADKLKRHRFITTGSVDLLLYHDLNMVRKKQELKKTSIGP